MKSRILYVILGVVVLGMAALLFFNGGISQILAQNCSSDTNRPCFEQEIGNNLQATVGGVVKKEKLDAERGQTEFAECIKNEANRRGQEKDKTKICDAEIIKYCEDAWNGDNNNKNNENRRIKKYEGTCDPEPDPTPSKNLAPPTVSFISPVSGRGFLPNYNMYFRVNVTDVDDYDYAKYGELMFNLARAGSVVQTFPYRPEGIGNGLAQGVFAVPASLPAGNDYTLEAFFANFPKKKIVSNSFSILGDSVKINAHVVDAFTGLPIKNASLLFVQNGVQPQVLTDASGNFSITQPNRIHWESQVDVYAACHLSNGFVSSHYYEYDPKINGIVGDNAFGISANQALMSPPVLFVPITGPSVDITLSEWPAVDLLITSDIPVTFGITYVPISNGPSGGPSTYSLSRFLPLSLPLDTDIIVTLIAQDGTKYASPILHLPRTHGCAPVKLIFKDGKSTWQY